MKIQKVTKTEMRMAERNLSRHILSLNDHYFTVEEQYIQLQGKKARAKVLAKELTSIKLHVKELMQIVKDFEELG